MPGRQQKSEGVAGMIARVIKYFPLTHFGILSRAIDKSARTLLDVGCGQGRGLESVLAGRQLSSVGGDLWLPDLLKAKRKALHRLVLQMNAVALPFADRSFDVVMVLDVLEHLPKSHGWQAIREAERVATRQVIVTVPNDFHEQDEKYLDGNPYQVHRSGWTPAELRERGFSVRGQGAYWLWRENGLGRRLPAMFTVLLGALMMIFAPLYYHHPESSFHLISVKDLRSIS